MASKKITIVVVPEGPRKIRQIKIPRFWVFSLVVLFLAASLSLAWVVRDYLSIKRDLPHLSSLQEENTLQKQQITSLAGKVEAINQKMAELKEFDRKVRAMVSMDPSKGGGMASPKSSSSSSESEGRIPAWEAAIPLLKKATRDLCA